MGANAGVAFGAVFGLAGCVGAAACREQEGGGHAAHGAGTGGADAAGRAAAEETGRAALVSILALGAGMEAVVRDAARLPALRSLLVVRTMLDDDVVVRGLALVGLIDGGRDNPPRLFTPYEPCARAEVSGESRDGRASRLNAETVLPYCAGDECTDVDVGAVFCDDASYVVSKANEGCSGGDACERCRRLLREAFPLWTANPRWDLPGGLAARTLDRSPVARFVQAVPECQAALGSIRDVLALRIDGVRWGVTERWWTVVQQAIDELKSRYGVWVRWVVVGPLDTYLSGQVAALGLVGGTAPGEMYGWRRCSSSPSGFAFFPSSLKGMAPEVRKGILGAASAEGSVSFVAEEGCPTDRVGLVVALAPLEGLDGSRLDWMVAVLPLELAWKSMPHAGLRLVALPMGGRHLLVRPWGDGQWNEWKPQPQAPGFGPWVALPRRCDDLARPGGPLAARAARRVLACAEWPNQAVSGGALFVLDLPFSPEQWPDPPKTPTAF